MNPIICLQQLYLFQMSHLNDRMPKVMFHECSFSINYNAIQLLLHFPWSVILHYFLLGSIGFFLNFMAFPSFINTRLCSFLMVACLVPCYLGNLIHFHLFQIVKAYTPGLYFPLLRRVTFTVVGCVLFKWQTIIIKSTIKHPS